MKIIKFEPGRKIFVTSDTHFGHADIIRYCKRPWLTSDELRKVDEGVAFEVHQDTLEKHDTAIVDNTNKLVGRDDVLIHAGDVAWSRHKLEEYANRIHCQNIYFTLGNHDSLRDMYQVFGNARIFERVMINVGDQLAVIDHYPGDSWNASHHGAWQLFGHVHGLRNAGRADNDAWALSLDVGVDTHDYTPWSWEELTEVMNSRKSRWMKWKQMMKSKDQGGMHAHDDDRIYSGALASRKPKAR